MRYALDTEARIPLQDRDTRARSLLRPLGEQCFLTGPYYCVIILASPAATREKQDLAQELAEFLSSKSPWTRRVLKSPRRLAPESFTTWPTHQKEALKNMGSQIRRWVVVGFVLILTFVAAFTLVTLLLPLGFTTPATFQITPSEITLRPNQGWQFRAVNEGRQVTGLTWTASGGKIGPEGFYTAPETTGDFHITAYHPSTGFSTVATVHVAPDGDVKPTDLPLPTLPATEPTSVPTRPETTPTADRVPTATSAPTQSPTPSIVTEPDPKDDLVDYTTLVPFGDTPPGSDIRLACFNADLHLVRVLPPELEDIASDWRSDDDLVFWIMLHGSIPPTIDATTSWLFAIDTDNDTTTGRPLDSGVINPDIGPEVTVGVRLDPTGEVYPYVYIWNAATDDSSLSEISVQARFSTARDAVLVKVSEAVLTSNVITLSLTQPDWEQAVGRAATLVTSGERTAIDFFPERP